MILEDELSQIDMARLQRGGTPVWQDSTPMVCRGEADPCWVGII